MARLTSIPPELVEAIILFLNPIDVAIISQCSRFFHSLVYNPSDYVFWRELYLNEHLDDPRRCVSPLGVPRSRIDWKGDLQRFVRARTVLSNPSLCRPGERLTVLRTLRNLMCHVPPRASRTDPAVSRNLAWIVRALGLAGAFLDLTAADPQAEEEEMQLCAWVHTHYGLTRGDAGGEGWMRSRGYVYDLRNYTHENWYGPYDVRGCVNWVHVRALHHVVAMHSTRLEQGEDGEWGFGEVEFPMSMPFTQIVVEDAVDLDREADWAGVGGKWTVSFCFCDHGELLKYNESVDDNGALDMSIFCSPDFGEVFRSLDFTLRVTTTIHNEDYPTRPTICFVGEMQGGPATMRGRVNVRPDGQIQWHFVSGDHSNIMWSSQGLQIGGIRSSFGVLGAWTTVFHDSDDPVGPFWLRRRD